MKVKQTCFDYHIDNLFNKSQAKGKVQSAALTKCLRKVLQSNTTSGNTSDATRKIKELREILYAKGSNILERKKSLLEKIESCIINIEKEKLYKNCKAEIRSQRESWSRNSWLDAANISRTGNINQQRPRTNNTLILTAKKPVLQPITPSQNKTTVLSPPLPLPIKESQQDSASTLPPALTLQEQLNVELNVELKARVTRSKPVHEKQGLLSEPPSPEVSQADNYSLASRSLQKNITVQSREFISELINTLEQRNKLKLHQP